jgi:hypothetical protein
VSDIVGFLFEDLFEQSQRLGRPASTTKYERQIGFGRVPARRKLDRAAKKAFGVPPATDAGSEFREHPDGGYVKRIFLEVRLEDALSDIEAIFIERHGGLKEAGMQARASGKRGRHLATVAPSNDRRYAPAP